MRRLRNPARTIKKVAGFAAAAVISAGLAFSCAEEVQIPQSERGKLSVFTYDNAKALRGGDTIYFEPGKHTFQECDEIFAVKSLITGETKSFRIANVDAKGFDVENTRVNFGETQVLGYGVLEVAAIVVIKSEPGRFSDSVEIEVKAFDGPIIKKK